MTMAQVAMYVHSGFAVLAAAVAVAVAVIIGIATAKVGSDSAGLSECEVTLQVVKLLHQKETM
mgnify:CR=1 FL=1